MEYKYRRFTNVTDDDVEDTNINKKSLKKFNDDIQDDYDNEYIDSKI